MLALAAACACAPRPCAAEDAAEPAAAWTDAVEMHGFLATSWSYNFKRPASGTNRLRVFDFDDDTFKLDVFELAIQRPAAAPKESGIRADVTFGGSIPRVAASAGLFRDEMGQAEDIDVQQAYASYVAPLGSGMRIDLGKFVTPFGYEVIAGYDGWNDNATRSFLFGYAIPFTHVGARAAYTFSPRVSGSVLVVNGWDVARDNNRSPSFGGQLALAPAPALSILVGGIIGPERSGTESDPRRVLDLVAIWKPSGHVTLGANADWGAEEDAVTAGEEATWKGAAGYLRWTACSAIAFSLRGETFKDDGGARTGTTQELTEITVTPEARLSPQFLLRADLRVDRSTEAAFEDDDGPIKTQPTVLLEALYSF